MLKFIALIFMVIDHLGFSFFPTLIIFRLIGRLSFPIFAFYITEGYIHTSNKKKYFNRLLIFALVSMIPYSFLFDGFTNFKNTFYVFLHKPLLMFIGHLNIGFTFVLGFVSLLIIDRIRADRSNIINYLYLIVILIFAFIVGVDYKIYGILSIISFYIFRNNKLYIILSFLILPITMINIDKLTIEQLYQFFSVFSIPIIFYLKDKNINSKFKLPRLFFYIFYPVHLTILWIIRCI